MSISYVLSILNEDFTDDNDFRWPSAGQVAYELTDFSKGLQGFLYGCGYAARATNNSQWLLVAVPTETLIDLGSVVLFPKGEVILSSKDPSTIIAKLEALDPETLRLPVIGSVRKCMDFGSIVGSGNYGTAISDNSGISYSGIDGTSVSGALGRSIVGEGGKAKSGLGGFLEFQYNDQKSTQFFVDGGTVKADTFYRCDCGILIKESTED
jgi:hypothetical protein